MFLYFFFFEKIDFDKKLANDIKSMKITQHAEFREMRRPAVTVSIMTNFSVQKFLRSTYRKVYYDNKTNAHNKKKWP